MSTSTTIVLDGEQWSIREALGDTAEWYLGAPLPEAGNNVAEASVAIAAAPGWLPARVPGAVVDDLHRAGELPDPRVGRNSRAAEWVAERSWVYRRAVDLDAAAADGVAVLEFDGVDPAADVYWDGELLGSVRGLYHRLRLPLDAARRTAGRHKLALRLHPAPDSEPQVGRTDRVRIHTPRLGYGWDFSPRLRHQGVWKSARLRLGRALLGEVTVRARLSPASSGDNMSPLVSGGDEMSLLAPGGGEMSPPAVGAGEMSPRDPDGKGVSRCGLSGYDMSPIASARGEVPPVASGGGEVLSVASGGGEMSPLASARGEVPAVASGVGEVLSVASGGVESSPLASGVGEMLSLGSGGNGMSPLDFSGDEMSPLAPDGDEGARVQVQGGPDAQRAPDEVGRLRTAVSGDNMSPLAPSGDNMSPLGARGAVPAGVVDVTWEPPLDGRPAGSGPLAVTVTVRRDGSVLATVTADATAGRASVRVPDPEIWWPNTLGGQPLYTVTVALVDADGEADRTERRVGFRTARMVPNADAPAGALPYTAVVNGVTVPLLGWNWTPADTLFGSIDDAKVEHLLRLAADSGARLVRVWGGGLIESEHFYATCDRLGLLVWQEFSQSSSGMQSAPSTDPAFVELMRAEAEAIVPTRVHHPSLLLWGGGNELDEGGVPLSDDRSPVLAALSETVARLDPHRAWLPTSPTGPEFHNRLDRIRANPDGQHDVHGPWEHQGLVGHYTLANAGTSLAHTEFGVEGMTNLRSLEALVPEADRWPADRSNPVYRHLGEWWNNADQVGELFGGRPDTLETLNRASQLLQATGLQYSVEADRRRFPRCSMVLPWQLNESYPNAWCTAAVDFRGDPKPAYFAVKRAFERRRATLRVTRAVWAGERTATAEVWLWAEDAVAEGSTVTLRALGLDGGVLGERVLAAPAVREPIAVGELEVPVDGLPDVFLWEAEWRDEDGVLDRERMVATTTADFAALFDVPAPRLEVTRGADGAVRVRNVGPSAALTVRVVDPRPVEAPSADPRLIGPRTAEPLSADPRPVGLRRAADEPRPVEAPSATPTSGDLRLAVRRPGAGPSADPRPAADEPPLTVGGDPRPLLPGEERILESQPGMAVRVEAWNAAPIDLA